MKKILFFLSVIISIYCSAQNEFQPAGSEIIETVDGDLDGDKILEKVIVYNTKDIAGAGNVREIQILRKVNGKWTILEKSRSSILGSKGGGMMGDPYGYTKIENGILIIAQSGGSSWKWGYTDRYRFQNGHFELIGHTSTYGRPGDYFQNIDYNLSTGKLIYKKEVEDEAHPDNGKSEKEIFIKKGLKINLQNRNKEERKIILPKTKAEIYL